MSPLQHEILWMTDRGNRHQERAVRAAPSELRVTICRQPSSEYLAEHLPKTNFLISERRGVIGQEIIQAAPKLSLIVRLGSLADDIDLDAAKKAKVLVSRQPIVTCMMVAEHCIMMALALLKKLNIAQTLVQSGNSERETQRTDEDTFQYNWSGMGNILGLYAKKIAIIGMGEIGIELARRLVPFEPETIYYQKRTRYPESVEDELGITFATLDECLTNAEIFFTLLPFSSETENIISREAIAKMPRGAMLIHAGSGSTIDETALVAALQHGHLGGVALDTFEYEPLSPKHPLVKMMQDPASNIILTPHIAAATLPMELSSRSRDYDEVMRFIRGMPLIHEIK